MNEQIGTSTRESHLDVNLADVPRARDKTQSTTHLVAVLAINLFVFISGAGISYLIGRWGAPDLLPQSWRWDSPLSIGCIALALFCAGISMMSFVIARTRNHETEQARRDVSESLAYARSLLARAQTSQVGFGVKSKIE